MGEVVRKPEPQAGDRTGMGNLVQFGAPQNDTLYSQPVAVGRVYRKLPDIREALGPYFTDLVFFFRNILLSNAYEIKVFMSRRAFVLLRICSIILGIPKDDIKGTLVCDNALPFLMGADGKGLSGKSVLVVDDMLIQGNSLLRTKKLLDEYGVDAKYMVFAKNKDCQTERGRRLRGSEHKPNDQELSDFYKTVFASHELSTGNYDLLGQRIVDTIGACSFPYLSFLPAFIMDNFQGDLPFAIPQGYTCFDASFKNYVYTEKNQNVKIFALDSGAFFRENTVSDAFLRLNKSDEGATHLIPFSILSEDILADEGRLEGIYKDIMGMEISKEIPRTPQRVYHHALESTAKLLSYFLGLALAKKCMSSPDERHWDDFRNQYLDFEGLTYGFGKYIADNLPVFSNAKWLSRIVRDDNEENQGKTPISSVTAAPEDNKTCKTASDFFSADFRKTKLKDDTGVDSGCFHERVAGYCNDTGMERRPCSSALVAEMDEGRVTYTVRYKDGTLRAVLTPGEQARNYCPDKLFPVLCVWCYYKDSHSRKSNKLWATFKEWYFSRFAGDEDLFDEPYLEEWVKTAKERPALFGREIAYRRWMRNSYNDEVLTKGFSLT